LAPRILDITWLRDESIERAEDLPDPEDIAAELEHARDRVIAMVEHRIDGDGEVLAGLAPQFRGTRGRRPTARPLSSDLGATNLCPTAVGSRHGRTRALSAIGLCRGPGPHPPGDVTRRQGQETHDPLEGAHQDHPGALPVDRGRKAHGDLPLVEAEGLGARLGPARSALGVG